MLLILSSSALLFSHSPLLQDKMRGGLLVDGFDENSCLSRRHAIGHLHIVHDYDDHDKLFFCDEEQHFLQEVPWFVMKTDNYFVPSLFLMPSLEQELNDLFPNKETVFHFLDQILACILKHKLLPDVNHQQDAINSSGIPKSKAVLMTSLSSGYFEKVRDMYWEYPTVTGEVVGVYQPSHEGYQQTQKQTHNQKAWAELYLLSLTDALVTSSRSNFGYAAQGLGGLKPWILYKPDSPRSPLSACHVNGAMFPFSFFLRLQGQERN
ncbi:hypothetical protein VNO80_21823 [Phaseolus coccineus]|uniref:Fucosyltransferase n=1 Tax=Phaseolus coccineus TaxID=3886 RepID=A0AAN9M8G7_PHACN